MFYPAYVDIGAAYFYALGNTPAASLTQHLPPDEPAAVLSLGCGDVRNVLFTAYCEAGRQAARPIDVTSCDLQRAVIARNILVFSLLLDDSERGSQAAVWNLYYHLFLGTKCFDLLHNQARKLHSCSASLDDWHNSPYGTCLRICDAVTLAKVRDVWHSYLNAEPVRSSSEFDKAGEAKKASWGDGTVLTAARSAAPFTLQSLEDLPPLFQYFWTHGTTDEPQDPANGGIPNPMFSCAMDDLTLHYGTDPLLGFHLATAYARLTSTSPLNPHQTQSEGRKTAVKAARQQFDAWCDAFRETSRHFTLRFFVGEAITFCHALQQKRAVGSDMSPQWYRGPYMADPLALDGEDYVADRAPLTFNVIDTSNLIDHFGAINLLVATCPLLDNSLSASLITETILKRHGKDSSPMDSLLCGNFSALSILIGLFPVEYWTNTALVSPVYETILAEIQGGMGRDARQLHIRVRWKKRVHAEAPEFPLIRCDENSLAQLLYHTYLTMFENEDPTVVTAKRSAQHIRNVSMPYYTRASYAALLQVVKHRVSVDWNNVFAALLDLIDNDRNLMLGANFLQELRVQLHSFGISDSVIPRFPLEEWARNKPAGAVLAWGSVPDIVNVTLKIPRARLSIFSQVKKERLGSPLLNCHTMTPTARSTFAVIQLVFGDVKLSGQRNTEGFSLQITEDERRWNGDSPLWVSFLVPAALLLQEPQNLSLLFTLQPTPYTIKSFAALLDDELSIFRTTLTDTDHVYVTRCRPNISAAPFVTAYYRTDTTTKVDASDGMQPSIAMNLDADTARLVTLTGRLELVTDALKSQLSSGAAVETTQLSPCVIGVKLGNASPQLKLHFPAPVLKSRQKVRVARKSSYIEVIVPLASPASKNYFPDFILPSFLGLEALIIWGATYIPISRLPILDTKGSHQGQWLTTHTSSMFSDRERSARDSSLGGSLSHNETRISFKDSIFTLLGHAAGAGGAHGGVRYFALHNKAAGGVHVLVLASTLRLDLANQSVVLDAAIVPLTLPVVSKIGPALKDMEEEAGGLCLINVDAKELQAWKAVLPAMVERCRTWTHKPDCAYRRAGCVPLSVADGETPLCACGNGIFPEDFVDVKMTAWKKLKPYAVRAAIAPVFSTPLAELQQSILPPQKLPVSGASGEGKERCRVCGKNEKVGGGQLLQCSRCKRVKYCSSECQRRDWKMHKAGCVAAA